MNPFLQALSHLSVVRFPRLPLPSLVSDDRDMWVPVVCAIGFCVLTLADWFAR